VGIRAKKRKKRLKEARFLPGIFGREKLSRKIFYLNLLFLSKKKYNLGT